MAKYLRSLQGRKSAPCNVHAGARAAHLEASAEVSPAGPCLTHGAVSSGALIEFAPGPAALWSVNRQWCVLNDPLRRLSGFADHDLRENVSLWSERIHPHDRDKFSRAWKSLAKGEEKVFCGYRFLPNRQSHEIRLNEVAFSYPMADGVSRGICSLYSLDGAGGESPVGLLPTADLVRGLTHEIGNNLQAISGELDLLRISGLLPASASMSIKRGVEQIRRLAHEIDEYLFPPVLQLKSEDPAEVLREVVRSIEGELLVHGIRVAMSAKESLPRMLLDGQFRRALRGVIDFSRALLPEGGELKIRAGLRRIADETYIEVKLISCSPAPLGLDERDVFRPFLKVNDYRVGLRMAVAREVLRRHFGKIAFYKEPNRAVFSILLRVAAEA